MIDDLPLANSLVYRVVAIRGTQHCGSSIRVLLFVALGNLLYYVLRVLVLDQVAFGGDGWVGGVVTRLGLRRKRRRHFKFIYSRTVSCASPCPRALTGTLLQVRAESSQGLAASRVHHDVRLLDTTKRCDLN